MQSAASQTPAAEAAPAAPSPAPEGGAAAASVPRALFSRAIDTACIGGLSLAVVLLLLVLPLPPVGQLAASTTLVLQALINWPHFMASNRLLYSSKKSVREHPFASIYFPLGLGLYAAFAVGTWSTYSVHLLLLQWTASLWLARHYTGQTWGMMASFSYVDGVAFTPRERALLRWGLHLAMVWHMLWLAMNMARATTPELVRLCDGLYRWHLVVAVPALLLGLAGLSAMTLRLGRLPPTRILVPWAAQYLWYGLLMKDTSAALVAQLAHAFQYLIFPLRIEANREQAADLGRLCAARLVTWIVLGFAALEGLPMLFSLCYHGVAEPAQMHQVVSSAVACVVATHHYFVDGALYKLRNPEVRRALFSHLQPARAASS